VFDEEIFPDFVQIVVPFFLRQAGEEMNAVGGAQDADA